MVGKGLRVLDCDGCGGGAALVGLRAGHDARAVTRGDEELYERAVGRHDAVHPSALLADIGEENLGMCARPRVHRARDGGVQIGAPDDGRDARALDDPVEHAPRGAQGVVDGVPKAAAEAAMVVEERGQVPSVGEGLKRCSVSGIRVRRGAAKPSSNLLGRLRQSLPVTCESMPRRVARAAEQAVALATRATIHASNNEHIEVCTEITNGCVRVR